jgi:hypothetical protein
MEQQLKGFNTVLLTGEVRTLGAPDRDGSACMIIAVLTRDSNLRLYQVNADRSTVIRAPGEKVQVGDHVDVIGYLGTDDVSVWLDAALIDYRGGRA